MTTLTLNITDEKDLPVLKEILDRFGIDYEVGDQYDLSDEDINGLLKTQQEFLEGKTTARDWKDIDNDLNRAYN